MLWNVPMTWRLTEILQHGFLDNRRDGIVSGRLVFLKALEPVEADIAARTSGEDRDLATPFEITLALKGNLPSPFSGSAVRIENRGPMPSDPPLLLDFPQSQSGELVEANVEDDCLHVAWQASNPTESFYVELDIPIEWVSHELC